MIPREGRQGKAKFSPSLASRSADQEGRKATPGCLEPARQVVLEPFDSDARPQHLVGDAPVGRALMLLRRERRRLDGNAAVRT
jgi:hypothetical protein